MRIEMKLLAVAAGLALAASLPQLAVAFPGMAQQQGQAPAQVQSPPQAQAPAPAQTSIAGRVVETMASGGYTYVCVENGGKKIWAAVPKTEVKLGQKVSVAPGMEMQNFTSKTLNRTFQSIYFSSGLTVAK